MEMHVHRMMEVCLDFLKQAKLVKSDTTARYINKMTVLRLQEEVQQRGEQYGADFIGAVFQRTSALNSMCHAKKLLTTHGYESFAEYMTNYFNLDVKGKKNVPFIKNMKKQKCFIDFWQHLEESRKTKNHPKLRKLAQILQDFFSDPENPPESKVIIFSQFRDSAKEIKSFLDKKCDKVKSDIFVG